MTSSRWLVIAAGIISVIGLIVNLTVDVDNIYDMTTSVLFLIALILAFVGAALMGREGKVGRRLPEQTVPSKTV